MEDRIIGKLDNYLILRMDKLYGYNDLQSIDKFTKKIIEKLKSNKTVELNCWQKTYPTLIDDVANFVIKSIGIDRKSICHIPGPEKYTRYSWGKTIAEVFGLNNVLLSSYEKEMPKRPKDPCMIPYPDIGFHNLREGLEIMKKQIGENTIK